MNARGPRLSVPVVSTLAGASCVVFLGIQTVRLHEDNRELRERMAAKHGSTAARASMGDTDADATARLRAEVDRETAALRAAEEKTEALAASLSISPGEELKSWGRLEELAKDGVKFLNTLNELPKLRKEAQLRGYPAAAMHEFMNDMVGWSVKMEAIGRLEDSPGDLAEFNACALREMLGLDTATTRRVQEVIAAEFTRLRAQGLQASQRPTEEQDAWYARRDAALAEAATRIEALIPAGLRKPHAVGQVLNLGSGLRSKVIESPDGTGGGVQMYYKAPGLEALRF